MVANKGGCYACGSDKLGDNQEDKVLLSYCRPVARLSSG